MPRRRTNHGLRHDERVRNRQNLGCCIDSCKHDAVPPEEIPSDHISKISCMTDGAVSQSLLNRSRRRHWRRTSALALLAEPHSPPPTGIHHGMHSHGPIECEASNRGWLQPGMTDSACQHSFHAFLRVPSTPQEGNRTAHRKGRRVDRDSFPGGFYIFMPWTRGVCASWTESACASTPVPATPGHCRVGEKFAGKGASIEDSGRIKGEAPREWPNLIQA